jgi:hypothetical protein
MYYPSRIRQLIDTGQHEQLAEVASYYRDLYAINLSNNYWRYATPRHFRLTLSYAF